MRLNRIGNGLLLYFLLTFGNKLDEHFHYENLTELQVFHLTGIFYSFLPDNCSHGLMFLQTIFHLSLCKKSVLVENL